MKGRVPLLTMFNLYPSNCPLDLHAKLWVENRLCWLSNEFGYSEFIQGPVIIPTNDFFTLPKNESHEEIQKLFHQVCKFMKVDPETVSLNIVEVNQPLWIINEQRNPAWAKYLSWDITPSFRQCVRFLFKTHDSKFKPAIID